MDANHPTLMTEWKSSEEAKQAVVEQALFEVFNPYSSIDINHKVSKSKRAIASYTVQKGDTLSRISEQFGITLQQLIQDNKLRNPNMVGIGMKLVINTKEMTHTVEAGESLELIARRYQVSKDEIINHNRLLKAIPDCLYQGQRLTIPVEASGSALAGTVDMRRQMAQVASRSVNLNRVMEWPIPAPTVTSDFGSRWGKMHKGVDLWNERRGNTPIMAAKEGFVAEAGAIRSGYGRMVVLDHGNGLQTFYAHMRKINVVAGQYVHQGDVLGFMGKTGDSTDYHLHFEVRQDDIPLNPMRYLRK
ncbi:metalloendopeptidase [Brevibacillus laterosporus]|uniref:M23 family metallopeptidase n=1 Tax=Brevibacillus laterosporus TaxID=1465 RepID=UPI000C7945EA|nr:M23 family metallopeptidase [Brevibacillus laterosporus]AUM67048.1 metalloendopeptidase [Brevibacillus laterosporus]